MDQPLTEEVVEELGELIKAQNEKIALLEKQLLTKKQEGVEDDNETGEVSLRGIYHDDDKGMRIELEWNTKFIKYLKKNGFEGYDEEEIVQKWLTFLLRDIEKSIGGRDDKYRQ